MSEKIGKISNYLAAVILLVFGFIYLFKWSFMPYHSEALSLKWEELEKPTQILILALMRAVSGGFIAVSVLIIILQVKFKNNKLAWIPLLILICGVLITLTTIYATMIVRLNSPGNPPTVIAYVQLLLLMLGYIFNRKTL